MANELGFVVNYFSAGRHQSTTALLKRTTLLSLHFLSLSWFIESGRLCTAS